MCRVLCSTGALIGLANNRNYRLLEAVAGRLACDGYEFMMYGSWYEEAERIVEYLQSLQLEIPVMHCEKRIGERISKGESAEAFRLFEINCRMAQRLGADRLVIHLWDGITSDSDFARNRMAYGELAAIGRGYGVKILVENVVCNVEDPMKRWQELADTYPDIGFVFDTKMAAFHDQLDLLYEDSWEWLWREGHISHYHINDYAGGYKEWSKLRTYPIGQGHIDFNRFFEHIRKNGYRDTFTVEATAVRADGTIDTELLNGQFEKIRRSLG